MMSSFLKHRRAKQWQPATNSLHHRQALRSPSTWTTTQRKSSRRSTTNSSVIPLTTPTATYTMLSTLVATRKQSSSTKGKIMWKLKLTVRCLIIGYLITTGTTGKNGAATRQHPLLNQSSRRLILLTRKFIQNASCTRRKALKFPMHHPSQSTRSTSTFCQQRQQKREPTRAKSFLTINGEGVTQKYAS